MANTVKTRLLILSDTHGAGPEELKINKLPEVDLAIHCGDLTQESRMVEMYTAMRLLKAIKAPLKLVIAGNHDWSLDPAVYQKKLEEARSTAKDAAITFKQDYGSQGEARALFNTPEAKAAGIVYLDEGTHTFVLHNGASLTVYASPYTPSTLPGWGFQYSDKHDWTMSRGIDVAITHGPPAGIRDRATPFNNAGCADLFAAVAKARPLMHCFGHVHSGWGAEKMVWNDGMMARWRKPAYERSVEGERTVVIETLANKEKVAEHVKMGFRAVEGPVERGKETLFVNAAVEGTREMPYHPAWIVDLELKRHEVA